MTSMEPMAPIVTSGLDMAHVTPHTSYAYVVGGGGGGGGGEVEGGGGGVVQHVVSSAEAPSSIVTSLISAPIMTQSHVQVGDPDKAENLELESWLDEQENRQTDRQTDRQKDRQVDRQTDN